MKRIASQEINLKMKRLKFKEWISTFKNAQKSTERNFEKIWKSWGSCCQVVIVVSLLYSELFKTFAIKYARANFTIVN